MRFCLIFLHLVVTLLISVQAEAGTRAPRSENERSLLYWRYLCENQPQTETPIRDHVVNAPITLQCLSQNWTVRADGDQVREVVEDAKK